MNFSTNDDNKCFILKCFSIVFVLILLISVGCNICLIYLYCKYKELKSPFNLMTMSISFSSLVAAVFGTPWDIYALMNCGSVFLLLLVFLEFILKLKILTSKRWKLKVFELCKFSAFLKYVTSVIIIYSMTTLSFQK
jgi:hypothetical protein